jgi:hypothetical protein
MPFLLKAGLVVIYTCSFIVAVTPLVLAQESTGQTANPSTEKSAGPYADAKDNALKALRAVFDKDLANAGKFAQMAAKAAEEAGAFAGRQGDREAQRDFDDAAKSLDNVPNFTSKGDSAKALANLEKAIFEIGKHRCEGANCSFNYCGGCAQVGGNCTNAKGAGHCYKGSSSCSCYCLQP